MTDSIPPVQFPIIEMTTGDELQTTLFRLTLAKYVPDIDAFLSVYDVKWRVAIRPATSTQPMLLGVTIWSATPKPLPQDREASL